MRAVSESAALREQARVGVVERARARRAKSEARIDPSWTPPPRVRGEKGTIVCRDCGCSIERTATHLSCDCGVGFVAQWDQCLGHGFFLGRILELQPTEVSP